MSERHRFEDAGIHSSPSDAVQALHEMLLQSNDNPSLCQGIQDALSLYPAALMAPVTEMVEQNGVVEEMASPHPTRLLLFRTLQRKLHEGTAASNNYWDCLLRAFQVARTLEGTQKHANGLFCDVPVAWMLQHGTSRLDVFWAFLQRHADTSRAFANVLLFQRKSKQSSACVCKCDPESHFLQRMHSETTLAASILALAIQNWPLTLWLKKKGSFSLRLVQGLDSALRVTYCCFQREKHSRSILSLVHALLRHIPWQEKLQSSCTDLVESLTQSLSNSNEARGVFLELCGGQMTPEGGETPMSPFIRAWLDTNSGSQWVQKLLQLHQQNQNRAKMNATYSVLCAMLTSNFIMFARNEELWQLFQDTLQALQGEKQGFELMEAVLKGRHSEKTYLRNIPSAWWDQITVGLAGNHYIAATVCSCCGYLRAEDWAQQDNVESVLEAIVSVCSDHRINAKWRTVSLKGLANVCSDLFTVSKAIQSQQNIILQTVSKTMNESNAQVQCMSLFVAGNLSLVLRNHEAILQSIPLWVMVSEQCLAKLQEDYNEKVTNNAIRSIGQIAALFLIQPDVGQLMSYVTEMVEALKERMQMSLPKSSDAIVLSWKQRSSRKRHCWGSCNSMANIFQSLGRTVLDCSGVLETLVEVIQEGGNEKVVISASKAIRSYSTSFQINLTPAIQYCVHVLEYGEAKSRLKEEMEMLLPVLLQNMTQRDFTCWISNLQDSKDKVLRWLFSWMVSRSVPSECFLALSDAMNRSGIQLDISIEQMFATAIRDDCGEDGDEL